MNQIELLGHLNLMLPHQRGEKGWILEVDPGLEHVKLRFIMQAKASLDGFHCVNFCDLILMKE